MRIVAVEDDLAIRNLIVAYADLTPDILVVAAHATVDEAIGWAGWADVDAALVDWAMPRRTGGELLDWLAEHHPHVRCVILTAYPSIAHRHAAAVVSKEHLAVAMEALRGR